MQKAPITVEAVARNDVIFAIEREVNGRAPGKRQAVRQSRSRPLGASLEGWLRVIKAKLSPKAKTAVAIDYMLKRWPALVRFLDDGRICLSNNLAERSIRPLAVGRPNWTLVGSMPAGGVPLPCTL